MVKGGETRSVGVFVRVEPSVAAQVDGARGHLGNMARSSLLRMALLEFLAVPRAACPHVCPDCGPHAPLEVNRGP